MIEAKDFVEAARVHGFGWYAGVPCSFLTPFINYVLQDKSLRYISTVNEGDAVALIAGVALSGNARSRYGRGITMMQNSGLGNAVSPLTSLTWTFKLPQLLIVTWRGQPGVTDEPQHALMGPITPQLLEAMEIPWEVFPKEREDIDGALGRALAYMQQFGRPYALLMEKGSVAAHGLDDAAIPGRRPGTNRTRIAEARLQPRHRPSRAEALRQVIDSTPSDSTAVLASTGFCGRELYAIEDRPSHFYMVGSMGCVAPLALGLALARPDLQVVAVDGDGAALMRMGAFATVGAYGPSNLRHLLLDNGAHDSTGGQGTVSPHISFAGVAASCGYASALETYAVDEIGQWFKTAPLVGTRFARLFIRCGTLANLPRPALSPVDVRQRFTAHFDSGSRAS